MDSAYFGYIFSAYAIFSILLLGFLAVSVYGYVNSEKQLRELCGEKNKES